MAEAVRPGRRLLWIHQNFVSARQTGISRAVYFLSALVDAGWTVDVVCPRTGYLDEALEGEAHRTIVERDGALTLHRLGVPEGLSTMKKEARGQSYFGFNRRALRYVRENLPPADLVFSSSPPLTVMLPAIACSLRWGVPLMVELRDLWPPMLVEAGLVRSRVVIKIMEMFEAFVVLFADHLITAAPTFATYYTAMGIPPAKLTTVPTGGDPVYLKSDPDLGLQWRRAQGLEGRFIALFTGSMNEISGVDLLADTAFEAARRGMDVVFVFAGNGRLKPAIEHAARELPNVLFLGAVPRDALIPLYAAADVGLICRAPWPLEETVYPGKLFDYMGSALPIITSHLGQPATVVEVAQCGTVVRERTPAAITDALAAMLALSPTERTAVGLRGQRWMLEHMNSYRMGLELLQVVERPWPRRSVLAGLGRFCAAGLQALGWSILGRQGKAVRAISGPDREAVIRAAFDAWFQRPDAAPEAALDFRLPTPTVLSARDA